MKQLMVGTLLAFAVIFLGSCKKNGCDPESSTATIIKKWNILSDSNFVGVGINNHQSAYTGKQGDYFDVRPDGYIYMKEDTKLDTLSYSQASNTTIIIAQFGLTLNGGPAISRITNLSQTSAIITAPVVITPGGAFGRKLMLYQ